MSVVFTYNGVNHTFRNPQMGNTDEISFQRVNRRTRGGDLNLFRDEDWPKTEVLNLTFNFTTEAEARLLLNFIRATIGQEINYRDHENRLWYGVIQNPDAEMVQPGRNTYQIAVSFEGDQV
jgi:hypothetical protein